MRHALAFLCLAVAPLTGPARQAPASDEARAILEKAIRAHGGADRLARLRAVRTKAEGKAEIEGNTIPFTIEAAVRLPDRCKRTVEIDLNGQKLTWVFVRKGEQAWKTVNGSQQEFMNKELASDRAAMHLLNVRSLLPLRDARAFQLAPLGEIQVDGRPAVGFKVTAKGQKDVDLYFDTASGLLVQSIRWGVNLPGQEVSWETFYRDYKSEVGGVQEPMRLVVRHDGKNYTDVRVTEVTFVDGIDDSEFGAP
jgi:hypothetical protein